MMKGARASVLVVDDNVDLVKATARLLTSKGYDVRTASAGDEGLRLLEEGPLPDCVILDVEMPGLTGPEMAYEMFRHDAGLENVPIILVSGRGDVSELADRVGTPYFLSKSSSHYMQVLLSLLARAVEERAAPAPAA